MDDQRFRKDERLRRRREYLAVQRHGVKIHLQHILAFVRTNGGGRRVGITVSGKVGNAVCRNRIKRLLREVWRHSKVALPEEMDIVLVAKRNAVDADFVCLTREVRQLARRLGQVAAKRSAVPLGAEAGPRVEGKG